MFGRTGGFCLYITIYQRMQSIVPQCLVVSRHLIHDAAYNPLIKLPIIPPIYIWAPLPSRSRHLPFLVSNRPLITLPEPQHHQALPLYTKPYLISSAIWYHILPLSLLLSASIVALSTIVKSNEGLMTPPGNATKSRNKRAGCYSGQICVQRSEEGESAFELSHMNT